jgi:uncharacterized DUF497 family protein
MEYYEWDQKKNERLKAERGISFEQVVMHIERGDILDIYEHPDREKYPGQQILVVRIQDYAYLVPFIESRSSKFLKTIIPSRRATRLYLEDKG